MLKLSTIAAFLLAVLLSFANSYLYDWPTGDEYWHFSYSKRFFTEGEIERESIHNYNSTTPFVVLNAALSEAAIKFGITPSFDKVIARLPAVGWYTLLLILSFVCAQIIFREADGSHARTIACWTTLLTCLDQNLLGHGSHIGSDMPFAVVTLVFLMALDAYRRTPTFKSAAILGLVLGLGFNVKYSTTFLSIFTVGYISFVHVRNFWKSDLPLRLSLRSCLGRLAAQVLLIVVLVVVIVDAAYGFKAIGLTFSNKEWYSTPFKFLGSLVPNLPLPLPLPFIAGFDHQFAAERMWSWNSIILGHESPNGAWFYFPIVWLVKTPLALLAVVFLGSALAITRLGELQKNSAFLLTAALFSFLLLYFCFVFRTQVGIRYTLMCLPLGYLLIAYVLTIGLSAREQSLVAALALLGTWFEAAPYFGNTLSFTNHILSDKSRVFEWIADSNVDWFQNYDRAKAAATQQLGNYSFNPPHLEPGNNLFTINKLSGVMRNFSQYSWIRKNLQPSGQFGYTLVWYDADTKTFERFLNETRTYDSPKGASDICPPDRVYKPLQDGTSSELGGTWEKPELYTACLKITEPTEIELTVLHGYGAFGSYPTEMDCKGDEAGAGESLWFKLPPGIHPICAKIMASAQAKWTVHRGKAELALRTR